MHYVNRRDLQHKNMYGSRNPKAGRLTPGSRAWYAAWIRKYEKAIKICKQLQKKAKQ